MRYRVVVAAALGVGVFTILAIGALSYTQRSERKPKHEAVKEPHTLHGNSRAGASVGADPNIPRAASDQSLPKLLKSLRVPPEFSDFEMWTFERQLNAVTDIQRNAHLSPAMCDFLVDLASDSGRREVLRNNASNAINAQDPPVPGWLGKLAEQVLDPSEGALWRDYALQHLSDQILLHKADPARDDFIGSPTSGLNTRRYVDILTEVASSTHVVAGTALLHLDRLSREQAISVDQEEFRQLLIKAIENPQVDPAAKVTAFGILGLRKNPMDADIARKYMRHSSADVRRSAIAALGNLGNVDDIAEIEKIDAGGNDLVGAAQVSALKKLRGRFMSSGTPGR
jgi:hypothetical protein